MLSRIEFIFSLHSLLGNQSSHINNPSNNLNVRLCVRSQVTRKLVLSQYQVGFKWRTTTQKLLNIFKHWCGASLSLCCGVFVFSSSSAISYLAAFNYTTGKMDAQYHSMKGTQICHQRWRHTAKKIIKLHVEHQDKILRKRHLQCGKISQKCI